MAPLRSVSLGSPSLMLTGEKSPIEGAPALSGTPGLLPGQSCKDGFVPLEMQVQAYRVLGKDRKYHLFASANSTLQGSVLCKNQGKILLKSLENVRQFIAQTMELELPRWSCGSNNRTALNCHLRDGERGAHGQRLRSLSTPRCGASQKSIMTYNSLCTKLVFNYWHVLFSSFA